jgi:hypothetical protein
MWRTIRCCCMLLRQSPAHAGETLTCLSALVGKTNSQIKKFVHAQNEQTSSPICNQQSFPQTNVCPWFS